MDMRNFVRFLFLLVLFFSIVIAVTKCTAHSHCNQSTCPTPRIIDLLPEEGSPPYGSEYDSDSE